MVCPRPPASLNGEAVRHRSSLEHLIERRLSRKESSRRNRLEGEGIEHIPRLAKGQAVPQCHALATPRTGPRPPVSATRPIAVPPAHGVAGRPQNRGAQPMDSCSARPHAWCSALPARDSGVTQDSGCSDLKVTVTHTGHMSATLSSSATWSAGGRRVSHFPMSCGILFICTNAKFTTRSSVTVEEGRVCLAPACD